MSPYFTVVVPVFNRTDELRRALASLRDQSYEDYECIVVDDHSTSDVLSIVREFDHRFSLLRTEANVGPSGARRLGYGRASGDAIAHLDSDNILFPWALGRAAVLLDANPGVSGVAGLYVFQDGLRTMLRQRSKVIFPTDYASGLRSPSDQVGVVRRQVMEEWLTKDPRYFAAEFHQWFTYSMNHAHLVVDEPWGRYLDGANSRVSSGTDVRNFQDVEVFVREHRPAYEAVWAVPLDEYLGNQWVRLARANRPERFLVAEWMRARDISRLGVLRRRFGERFSIIGRRTYYI